MSFFHTMIRCCSGFQAYREVRDLPMRDSLLYLFRLLLLLGLVLAAVFVPQTWQFANTVADWSERNLPPFRIEQGKLRTNAPQPYRAGDRHFLFVLDTTGKITEPDPHASYGVLLTSDFLLFWMKTSRRPDSNLVVQRHNLRAFPDAEITPAYLRNLVRAAILMSLPVFFVLGIVVLLGQVLLFSLVGAFIERSMINGLRWPQLFNIAVHAVTPAAVIFTVYVSMRLEGLDLQLVYVVAYGIFLLGATNACRNPAPDQTPADNEWL